MVSKPDKPVTATKQKKIKDWLKAKGRDKNKVDVMKMDTEEDIIKSVVILHKITHEQYKGGGVG